ncbi:MAG: CheY-like chemotaxis protein [Polaribacter sp.]|jgi:CheY-like chemotaxis protein
MNTSIYKSLNRNTTISDKLSSILNNIPDFLKGTQKKSEEKETKINLATKTNEIINSYSLKGKKILVVDDNIMNRMVANVILKEFDVLVSEANDGEEAVNYLQNNTCDLILMDLEMPILNGYEASKIIRHKLKLNIPIIALTASNVEEEKKKCFEVGMNDYLFKPFNKYQFLQIIYKWLDI